MLGSRYHFHVRQEVEDSQHVSPHCLLVRKNGLIDAASSSSLDDKSYHRTLDALFQCVVVEKQAYYGGKKVIRASKGTKPSVASTRLTKCAVALRTVVERGVATLKKKTVSAVIDHITQTLLGPADELVFPLLQDFLKALASILGHGPHVESLASSGSEGWITCTDFVVQIIEQYIESGDQDQAMSRASPAPGAASTFSAVVSTLRSASIVSSQRSNAELVPAHLHNLTVCLSLLVSASNAPLRQRSQAIANAVLQVLRLPLNLGAAQQLGFSIINELLKFFQTDDIDSAKTITADLVPLVNRWWQGRMSSREDALWNSVQIEILKTLCNMYLPLTDLMRLGRGTIQGDLEELCDTLWSEYARRDSRAQLSQDDLAYSTIGQHVGGFSTNLFGLQLYNVDGERRWAFIHILSIFESILQGNSSPSHVTVDHDEQPRKKRRTEKEASRLVQKLQSLDSNVQFAALQVVPFLNFEMGPLAADHTGLISAIGMLTTDKSAKLATWAMIAAARLLFPFFWS
jgi:serine-protein kinase ATM